MSNKVILGAFIGLLVLVLGCKKVETETDTGVMYFPLQIGTVNLFSVDSIVYNSLTNRKDSIRSYFKEVVVQETLDSHGFKLFKTDVYVSSDTSKSWRNSGYFYYKSNAYLVNRVFQNSTTTILVFPVTKNRKWDMNLYNQSDPLLVSYSSIKFAHETYTDCIEVFINEDINPIEESINKSIYARDKGLIYKISSNLKLDNLKKNGVKVITKRLNK